MNSTEQLISTFLNGQFGGLSTSVQVLDPSFFLKSIVDETDPNNVYIGYALPGSDTTDPVWTIKRVNTNGTITTIAFASGVMTATLVWDDRAGYSYS